MAENIIESFVDYLDSLTDEFQPHIIYRGEFLAKRLYPSIKEETDNWIVWENKDSIEICKVNKQDNYIFISEIFCFPNPFFQNEITKNVFYNDNDIAWLNLCHFKDTNGLVHYDSYFDTFPAIDNSEDCLLSVGQLRNTLAEIVKTYLPFNRGDQVFLYNRIGRFNILLDILAKNGVTPLNALLFSENIKQVDHILTSAPLNLYMIEKNVNVVVSMPENKDILIRVYVDNLHSNQNNFQIQHTNCDMMGNRWLSIIFPDGVRQSTWCIKSTIKCKTNILVN